MRAHDEDLAFLSKWMEKFKKDLATKMDQNDKVYILTYFERFATYEDLKELYDKTLPAIKRFESQLMS